MGFDVNVLVVGAGPTGLLLAAELHRRGVSCRVIDAHDAPLHWDRATVVHPRSLEIFEALGFVEPFLERGVKQRIARLHAAGSVLGVLDLATCGSRYGYNVGISEEVTESILTTYLERMGGSVVRASRLVALRAHEDGVVATIAHDGATHEIAADWVVGCDGLHSITREIAGIELDGHDIVEPWAVFDATLTGWVGSHEGNFAYFDDVAVILTALPDRRFRVYLRPTSPESDLVADAFSTIGRYLPDARFDDVENPVRFHCHTKVARDYRAGRILIAGDAAHVCSPAQGHGMNSGLQDAYNLAWKLALVCEGRASAELLDSYAAERRPVAEVITLEGDAFEDAQRTAADERPVRDAKLRQAFADAPSRHHEAIAEAELDIDYGGSPIVLGDAHPVLGPGQRLPDTVAVRHASGARGFLHELAHRAEHTALLIGGASARADELAALARTLRDAAASGGASIVAATCVLAIDQSDAAASADAVLTAEDAARLGATAATLLVVRPDGHVGLRADRDHVAALARYQRRLATGGR